MGGGPGRWLPRKPTPIRQLLAMKVGPPAMVGQSRDANWSVRLSGRPLAYNGRVGRVMTRLVMNESPGGTGLKGNGRR
ncbi:protein of unknown function [Burkholderia multivorans]